MAMLHKKDLPTYYRLIGANGDVVATVAKSKVFTEKHRLEQEHGELTIQLVEDKR